MLGIMDIQNLLRETIQQALTSIGIEGAHFALEFPTDSAHGDYATNVAMVFAKQLGKNPKELAGEIKTEIEKALPQEIAHIEIAGPGFINFTLSNIFFVHELNYIEQKGEVYGKSTIHDRKNVLIEHSSPNLFKAFHIGHVMNNTVGEAISRLAKFSGAEVKVISYPSDISLGIGKAVYIMLADGKEKLNSYATDTEKLAYLGECYVRGTKAFEESDEIKTRVREITKHLYDHAPSEELTAYEAGKEINLDYFKKIVARLGSHFDAFIYESEAGKVGQQIVESNAGSIFTKSEGAVVYEGEKVGLHTRVFINSEGYPTYEAKDIGLMSLKFERYNPDLSIFITDHEQTNYFEVVKSAAGEINPVWAEKTVHRTHGRMSFKGQKMSSRLGGVPLAATLIDTVVEEVKEKNPESTGVSADMIAIGALKLSILRAKAGSNINFDPETSLSFEGDSGPYLQYSIVRAKSVLNKALAQELSPVFDETKAFNQLERQLTRFPFVVEKSIAEWAPHHVAIYVLELAHLWNSWYGNTHIIDSDKKVAEHNLFIAKQTAQVLENAVRLLGIEIPQSM